MADRFSSGPASREAAEREARRATADLFARIRADRRTSRRWARLRSRGLLVDLMVAMATYTGLTVAAVLGAVYGICTAVALLNG